MSCLIFTAVSAAAEDDVSRSGDELIKLLFDKQDVRKSETGSHVWHIKNKYYTAQVKLVVRRSLSADAVSDDVRAVIYYGGDGTGDDWDSVAEGLNAWHSAIANDVINQEDDERIKMVVYKSLEAPEVSDRLKTWTLSKSVELVDLSEKDDQDEAAQPFHTGNNRVVDALTAYAGWPPPSPQESSSAASQEEGDRPAAAAAAEGSEEDLTFDQLFSQLSKFRDSAETLPNDQRKVLAEELALAFYSAIGGGDSDSDESSQQ